MPKPYAIIVEDDPKLSAIFQATLEKADFETAIDANGDKYPALLDKAEPTLVILDIHLPFASGVDILEVIRKRYPNTVVVVVTADFIKAKTVTGKADHVLIKPVSVARLLKIAESVKN
ncbi:MAG: response regulator [Anaerolineales bacterium]|nr:response regulator [Anaerolineales bacterium]MCZ2122214.1 response regulator [Anaerolineales bacterium]